MPRLLVNCHQEDVICYGTGGIEGKTRLSKRVMNPLKQGANEHVRYVPLMVPPNDHDGQDSMR